MDENDTLPNEHPKESRPRCNTASLDVDCTPLAWKNVQRLRNHNPSSLAARDAPKTSHKKINIRLNKTCNGNSKVIQSMIQRRKSSKKSKMNPKLAAHLDYKNISFTFKNEAR